MKLQKRLRGGKNRMHLLWISLGALLILDTIFVIAHSNLNFGVILPAILGLPLLIYGIFYSYLAFWFSYGVGLIFKWVIIIGYLAVIILICTLSILISRYSYNKPPNNADALIVLGAGVRGQEISMVLKNRLDLAIKYLEDNPKTVVVVAGGQGPQEHVSEARAMKDYLVKQGMPDSKIVMEDKSTSTLENFTFSKEILDNMFKREYEVVFVTNDFHVYRATRAAKAAGLEAVGIGCKSHWYVLPNYYAREAFAILRYELIGLR